MSQMDTRTLLFGLLCVVLLTAGHATAGEDLRLWGKPDELMPDYRTAVDASGYLSRDPKAKYPEVWGAELPTDGVGKAEDGRIFLDTQGRVQILYGFDLDEERVHRAYDFFANKVLAEWRMPRAEDAASAQQRAGARHRFAAYWREQVHVLVAEERGGVAVEYQNGKAVRTYWPGYQYEEGLVLSVHGFNANFERTPEFLPFTYHSQSVLVLPEVDKNARPPWKMLIRVYPQPQRLPMDSELVRECTCVGNYRKGGFQDPTTGRQVAPRCQAGGAFNAIAQGWVVPAHPITYRGRALDVVIADLRDGTFLVKDRGRPAVIRFRGDLGSPYLAQAKDLHVVDAWDMTHWLTREAYDKWVAASGQDQVELPLLDPAALFEVFDRIVVEKLEAGYHPKRD
ncbi:MAG: hypothetical protein H5U26_10680 [Immundisolibacter sp.]|uniref:hypothetical protein n=1 Tax=Immundisolibacter sp. TaxID=1934948 RepID=UPI0019ABFCB2|nr:hypothetical protein [Immundisolibacter sp.]MBC7162556.1 hypothetical protein [Immundisolibacter sp.]